MSIELKPKIFKKNFSEVTNSKRPKTREIGILNLRKTKRFERKTKKKIDNLETLLLATYITRFWNVH